MAENQTTLRDRAGYLGMLIGYLLLGWTPLFFAKALAAVLADVWRLVDTRHRRRIIEQSMAGLGIDRARAERLARDNYRHYAYTLLEIFRLAREDYGKAIRRVDTNGTEARLAEILSSGKGLVLAAGHLGNWEWGCMTLGRNGATKAVIARPLDNPLINAFLNRIRLRSGVEVWNKDGAIRKALAALKRGENFVAVVDQDGGPRGVMVPFLGRPASTMSLPIELAVRVGSPVMAISMMRDGSPMRFKMVFGRVHWPEAEGDPEREKMRLLTAVNDDLCDIIRDYPEQWIWILNRWKTDRVQERPNAITPSER